MTGKETMTDQNNFILLKIEAVANQLQVSTATVWRLIKNGKLRAVKIGKSVRIHPADLEEFIRSGVTTTAGHNQDDPKPGHFG